MHDTVLEAAANASYKDSECDIRRHCTYGAAFYYAGVKYQADSRVIHVLTTAQYYHIGIASRVNHIYYMLSKSTLIYMRIINNMLFMACILYTVQQLSTCNTT